MQSPDREIRYFKYNLSCSADNGALGEKWCYGEERILELEAKEVNAIHIRALENWLQGPGQDKVDGGIYYLQFSDNFVHPLFPPSLVNANDPEAMDAYLKQEPIAQIVYLAAKSNCSECDQIVNYGFGVRLKKEWNTLEAVEEIVRCIEIFKQQLINHEMKQINLDGGDLGAGDNV